MAALLFNMPHIMGMQYTPGPQPYDPGVPTASWINREYVAKETKPWPRMVGSILNLQMNPGTPRMRGGVPFNNAVAVFPFNNLFIAGFVGKSQG